MNKYQTLFEKEFNVIGIAITTNNEDAIKENTIIKLWQKFFDDAISLKIKNKINNEIIALYYNYENDKNGKYNILIGHKVENINEIPEDMVYCHIPSATRSVFVSECGPISNIVFDLWKKIWKLESENKLIRNYDFDYEMYNEDCQDPQNAKVEIHISVNS